MSSVIHIPAVPAVTQVVTPEKPETIAINVTPAEAEQLRALLGKTLGSELADLYTQLEQALTCCCPRPPKVAVLISDSRSIRFV